jgi:hypothetical protein
VEHRAGVQKLAIELQAAALSGERAPVIDAAGMVEQQRRLGIPDQLRDLTVGSVDSFDRKCLLSRHCHLASPAN